MTYSSGKTKPYSVADVTSQCSVGSRLDPAPGDKDESEIKEPDQPRQGSGK